MVVVDMKNHDIILGRKWFETYDVLPDCKRRTLAWPDDRTDYIGRYEIPLPRSVLSAPEVNPLHQADACRRDQKLDDRAPRVQILKRSSTKSYQSDYQQRMLEMAAELRRPEGYARALPLPTRKERRATQQLKINIARIGSTMFYRNLKLKDNEFFTTSIYEIDRILEEREAELEDTPFESEEAVLRRTVPKEYHDLLDVFSKKASNELPPHRIYDHKIVLEKDLPLGYNPLYQQTTEELQALKAYLIDNLEKGFITHSSAPFASPILFVKKADGSLRFCVDYRKLNEITRKDRYPLPLLDETLARLSSAKVFTKLDIRQAFHRIRMDPESEELTTFRTRYGQYKCKVLPFGLTNGPATYQRYMNDVLFDYLDDFCTAYLDDILIYSSNAAEHELHVRKVLERLRAAGLQADIRKCEFGVTRTKYLGFIVSTDGIEVDPEKIEVIRDWKEPKSVKGVQSFLGFCNFYRRFIQNYGRIAKPLNELTQKERAYEWDSRCQAAFDQLKLALTTAPVLQHYHPERDTTVETDASDGVVSGILSQKQLDDLWRPVAYYSKTMSPAECNYTIHDKELLAIIRAFEAWRAELESLKRPAKVYSDHQALTFFMTKRSLSARQARWAELLSRYHFMITYRSGKQNQRADALTRREEDVKSQNQVKLEARTQVMIPQEKVDLQIRATLAPVLLGDMTLIDQILQKNRESLSLEPLRSTAREGNLPEWQLQNGLLTHQGRLVVPDEADNNGVPLRTGLIREAHDQVAAAHPGQEKTSKSLRARYYWKGMNNDVERYVRNCHACRRSHVPRDKTPGLLHLLPVPDRPWQHISMDFKSFPRDKKGYDSILVIVDRLGKRPISIPCYKTATARDLARMFIESVWRYYGPPDTIVSDRGPQFIADFWNEFCTILGIKLKLSTADQPQTDGQTEIVNQYIDQRLRPFVSYYQDDWSDLLPIVDFAQASLEHTATGQSSFQTELAYSPRTSFDWREISDTASVKEKLNRTDAQEFARRIQEAWKNAREGMKLAQVRYQAQANRHRREPDFTVGDRVWVRTKSWRTHRPSHKLDHQMAGPFQIVEQIGHSFRLELPPSIKVHPVFHASKLRKASEDPLPGQHNPAPPPIEVDGELEWEVEKILGVRTLRKQLRYRVKWVGLDDDPDEYLPEDLNHSPRALRDFHAENPTKPGPPKNLDYWLECAERDISPEPRRNDNSAV
jgi:transposase InsO family protein